MTTPAAETPPPAAAKAPAPAAADDDTPLPPLDHDAEVGVQIKRAKENVTRAERRAAKKQKAEKPKAKAAEPVEPPKEEPHDTDPAPPPEEPSDLEQPSAATLVKARQLAEKGDLDAACKLAFGKDASAFRLNSARWAEWRKSQDKAERAMAAREQRVQEAARELAKTYGPLKKARELYAAEDYEGALQSAFEVDLNTHQKKLISKFHGKNPEVEALKKQLAERDEREAKAREEAEQRQRQQTEQQQHQANVQAISQHLGGSNDEQLSMLAKKPRFVRHVYNEFLQRVDNGEPPSMLLVVACAEEIRDGLTAEFGDIFTPRDLSESGRPHPGGTNPESPHQAGKKPARPGTAPAAPSTLSQRGASEASSPSSRTLTDEELYRKYTDLAKAVND